MKAIALAALGLTLCGSAYACGGASDALNLPLDGGVDATAPGSGSGASSGAAGDTGALPGEPDANGSGSDAGPLTRPDADAGTSDGNAPPADAALDGSTPDGAAAAGDGGPVAGRIACGATTCATASQFCCAMLDGGASCQANEGACVALGGVQRQCEKTADCPANNVCCYEFTSIPATTGCHANDCNGGGGMRVEACRSQSDCTTGTCSTHTCVAGGSIQSCAPFATECP
jgi:hypothetical protein